MSERKQPGATPTFARISQTAPAAPQPEVPRVFTVVEMIDAELVDASRELSNLEDRLNCVLSVDEQVVTAAEMLPTTCPLVESLDALRRQSAHLVARIRNITRRLEV